LNEKNHNTIEEETRQAKCLCC